MDIREFKEQVFKTELKRLVTEKQEQEPALSKIQIARALSIDLGIPDYMSLYRVMYAIKIDKE